MKSLAPITVAMVHLGRDRDLVEGGVVEVYGSLNKSSSSLICSFGEGVSSLNCSSTVGVWSLSCSSSEGVLSVGYSSVKEG